VNGARQHLPDWLRFVSLLLGFVTLLFIGYRRFAVSSAEGSRRG
jgi:hypothetical protein